MMASRSLTRLFCLPCSKPNASAAVQAHRRWVKHVTSFRTFVPGLMSINTSDFYIGLDLLNR